MKKPIILIVEDEGIVAADIQLSLESGGYIIAGIASTGEEAIKKTGETRPDLILMDIFFHGDMNGTEAAAVIKERFNIPIVYLSAYSDPKTLEQANVTEPFWYILKPFDMKEMHATISIAMYKHAMELKLWMSMRQRWSFTGMIKMNCLARMFLRL